MAGLETFEGEIKVSSQIVDYLSSGLYETPAACLKELVNNSFDADAQRVDVFVKPDADRIILEDDGAGISREEFTTHFDRVSESHKRDASDHTPSGRPIIGKIGIGFIAANEICDLMEVYSTKKGSRDLVHITIDFAKMREPAPQRRRGERGDLAKADYVGEILEEARDTHYTKLFLTRVRGPARELLAGAKRRALSSGLRSLCGLSPMSVRAQLSDPSLKDWAEFDPYSETVLRVALTVPVRYHDEWSPETVAKQLEPFSRQAKALGFRVFYDGAEIRRPIVFSPKKCMAHTFSFKGKEVSAEGYFFAQHGALRPQDLNGLLVRIRNTAIGGYDATFMGYPTSIGTLFQRWISAEIWADDRLEDALNIDRKTLRVSHPAYVELQTAVHEELARVLKAARERLYQTGSAQRARRSAGEAAMSLREFATDHLRPVAPQAARSLAEAWMPAKTDVQVRKKLLRKFTVLELYEIILEVARETLTRSQLARFFERLTARLQK